VIGIDTNVLVRHFVQDDPEHGAEATRFLTTECTVDRPGFVGVVALCELAWVLGRFYRYSRDDVLAAVRTLLATSTARVEQAQLVRQAVDRVQRQGGDFSDHLILLLNLQNGCEATVTFDRRFARLDGTRLLAR
jgi:predicted nucleic-acid-binding protein